MLCPPVKDWDTSSEFLDLSCMVVVYCKGVFLISASKYQVVYTRDVFLIYVDLYKISFFYEEKEVRFYFGIVDCYFGIRGICPKNILGYLRK